MKKYIIVLIMAVSTVASAQIDEQRMKRDIEVASTVLNSLLDKQGIMSWQSVNGTPSGRYIEGYGVILNMPNNHLVFGNMSFDGGTINNNFMVRMNDEQDQEEIIVVNGEVVTHDIKERQQERVERARELAERERELAVKAEALANKTIRFFNIDSLKARNDEKRLEKMQLFLLDYAHLISQLKPDEKVLILDNSEKIYISGNTSLIDNMRKGRLSAEITMKDAVAFQNGKITREEAQSRLVINKNDQPKKVYKDLELFQSIMERIYSRDLSESYYANGSINYEHIEELGAIYYMKTVSSSMSNNNWNIPTVDKSGLNQAERDEVIKNLYPQFEAALKENMVEYGRTISSLKDEEQLIINVGITKCEGCNIPQTLELSINAKTLQDFNSGKIDKKTALVGIKVTQGDMQ
ncbi:MAG: hypothetical protein ACI9XJ_002709 [Marivirga sp.]|jgi:hypothetical protein